MPLRHPRAAGALASLLVGLLTLSMGAIVTAGSAVAASFTGANLVVVRVGDASASLSSAATPVFLDEYSPTGTLVQSVPLPSAANGSNRPLTMSGSATSDGALALSADGRYLTLAGYAANPGTPSVVGTSASTTPRVVARVGGDGIVDTSTAITDAFSANNVRGAVTDDGSRFWAVGANSGVRLAPLGSAGTSTSVSTTVDNLRTVSIADGQLYVTTSSGTAGVHAVGTGTPTTTGATAQLVTGAASPFAAVFLDRSPAIPGVDSLYVASDSGSPGGGILKFSFDGTTWTARGSFRPAGSGARGLTGVVQPDGNVGLVATTSTTTNSIVRVTDAEAFNAPMAATGTTLATAAANTALRVSNGAGAADSRTATVTVTTEPPTNTAPTISPTPVQELALTIGDPHNPPAVRTVDVADAESPVGALAVTVTSSDSVVATGGSTGTGGTRTLTVTPVGVGRATLTVTVSDGSLTASTTFPVAISGALPAGTLNHYGASDASTAVDLGDGAMVVGDDENNLLRVYSRTESRYPAQELDVRAAGLALRDSDPTREIDIEASARAGNTIYWLGSHGPEQGWEHPSQSPGALRHHRGRHGHQRFVRGGRQLPAPAGRPGGVGPGQRPRPGSRRPRPGGGRDQSPGG